MTIALRLSIGSQYQTEDFNIADIRYIASEYGDQWAATYDEWFPYTPYGELAVAFIAERAASGSVLELGVGSGRLAIPLAQRGVSVHGIDASATMLTAMREKPGGDRISTTLGDMTNARIPQKFDVVFIAFNTMFLLPTQELQVQCFANAHRHLAPGGLFIVEAFFPDVNRFDEGQTVRALEVGATGVLLEASTHNTSDQIVDTTFVRVTPDGNELLHARIRYAWPSELDLMARCTGLALEDRFGGWDASQPNFNSLRHVSIYRRREAAGSR